MLRRAKCLVFRPVVLALHRRNEEGFNSFRISLMTLPGECMAARDERNGFLVIHCHATERLPNVLGRCPCTVPSHAPGFMRFMRRLLSLRDNLFDDLTAELTELLEPTCMVVRELVVF